MMKTLKISLVVILCSFSFVSAQEFEDSIFYQVPEDRVPVDSVQQRLDLLFARASCGVVRHKQLADSSKKVLLDMGIEAVPYLAEKLGSKNVRDVITSIDILKQIGSPAVPHLIESLADTSRVKVRVTIRVLGEMKDGWAVVSLINVLSHEDYRIRSGAATALGEIGDSSAVDDVIPLLNDTANLVRKSAAFALGEMRSVKSLPYLLNALSDEFYGTRFAASNSLVEFGQMAVKPLISLLNAQDPKYLCLVIETLGRIGDKEAVKPLLEKLDDPDWAIRGFTVQALGDIGVEKGMKAIKDLREMEKHSFVKKKIEEVLEEENYY